MSNVKYLDETLSGSEQAVTVVKKATGRLAFLYRNASLLDQNCRKLLCMALIQPYFDYCSSCWYSGLTARLRERLDVLQRRMVRFIFSYNPRHHVGSGDVKALSWLFVRDRVRYFKVVHVHKVVTGRAPEYLVKRFVPVQTTHTHNTRSSSYDFHISKEISRSPSSFSYTATKEWNALPNEIKAIGTEKLFRRKLHDHYSRSY